MKFMKLGSKSDQFQTDGDNIRYVATELATDLVIGVGDVKFRVHKFPLLSKSARLQKLIASAASDEVHIDDIPGGPASFEVCAKFCYGMVVTLNAYNVVAARCAAEYLEMHESLDKGNLVHKIDVFLSSSIFRTWKDSIIVLHTTRSLRPWSEDLKIASHSLDSIASKASVDPSRVDWSYTYNRKNGHHDPPAALWKQQSTVPIDWWVEDICELQVDLYKRVVTAIQAKGRISSDVIGESLRAYALKRLPGVRKGNDLAKYRHLVQTVTGLLPNERSCVPCGFLLKLLQASCLLECDEAGRQSLMVKIAEQLGEATLPDLLNRAPDGEVALYDMDVVRSLVERFAVLQECGPRTDDPELQVMYAAGFNPDDSKIKVAQLVDGYLAEAARDPSLPLSQFLELASMVSSFPRTTHDGIYRAIDMFLKEHPEISKGEKKKICGLMDCGKLSGEACAHAVQNERLPLRVVVQVLFFEQARASSNSLPAGLAGSVRALLPGGSCGSSRSETTQTDEDRTSAEIRALKGELASLRLSGIDSNADGVKKKKKMVVSRLWSNKDSSSDTSESPASTSE